jgi:G3E family GTPase
MTEQGFIPLTILTGYLGAGKTTVINRLLRHTDNRRIAVIVNDFGDINIDASLIAEEAEGVLSLTNGCMCCSLQNGFTEALMQILARRPLPDAVLVEASGVADAARIAQNVRMPGLVLDGIVAVADAESVEDLAADKYVGGTVLGQLAQANVILLNKIDLVADDVVRRRIEWLHEKSAHAPVMPIENGAAPIDVLMGIGAQVDVLRSLSAHPAYETWVFEDDVVLDRDRFSTFLDNLEGSVLRLKGIVAFQDGPVIVQMVGRRWRFEPVGQTTEIDTSRLTAIGLKGAMDRDAMTGQIRPAAHTE